MIDIRERILKLAFVGDAENEFISASNIAKKATQYESWTGHLVDVQVRKEGVMPVDVSIGKELKGLVEWFGVQK